MKIFEKVRKTHRAGGHYYYGDFGETPAAISYVEAANDEELGQEPRHYSRDGYKYFVVLKGALEIEVNNELLIAKPEQVLMIEPREIHRVVRLVEAPVVFWVFGTVKDPTGADKVVVE